MPDIVKRQMYGMQTIGQNRAIELPPFWSMSCAIAASLQAASRVCEASHLG